MSVSDCIFDVPSDCHFTLDNIPFGIFSVGQRKACVGTAIGDYVLDLSAAAQAGLFDNSCLASSARQVFSATSLNDFMSLGRPCWREARSVIQGLLTAGKSPLSHDAEVKQQVLIPSNLVKMHLPFVVGDYTDFLFLKGTRCKCRHHVSRKGKRTTAQLVSLVNNALINRLGSTCLLGTTVDPLQLLSLGLL